MVASLCTCLQTSRRVSFLPVTTTSVSHSPCHEVSTRNFVWVANASGTLFVVEQSVHVMRGGDGAACLEQPMTTATESHLHIGVILRLSGSCRDLGNGSRSVSY